MEHQGKQILQELEKKDGDRQARKLRKKKVRLYVRIAFQVFRFALVLWFLWELYHRFENRSIEGSTVFMLLALIYTSKFKLKIS